MLSHHILMNILSMNFHDYFVTKRSRNNAPYRKFSLNCNIPKQEKNIFRLNAFLIRFLLHLYTARIRLSLITSEAFRSSRWQLFYEINVLENFAKFTGKHPCWNSVNICSDSLINNMT